MTDLRKFLAETSTFYSGSNDDDLPTTEQLLYTTLQKEGFVTKDQRLDNTAFGVEATAEERGGLIDHNGSAPSDNSGRSPGEHTHYPLSWK
jgi:hypothetical protein